MEGIIFSNEQGQTVTDGFYAGIVLLPYRPGQGSELPKTWTDMVKISQRLQRRERSNPVSSAACR
jgi:hypothetical protein